MSDKTKIEWTDATWNIITGCSVVSSGCTNCYAMKLAGTRLKNHESRIGLTDQTNSGPVWNGAVRFNEQWLEQPLNWKKPRMIFVCAHGDLFHENVPNEWLHKIFAVMALCPQHTFQVLTKRPERMQKYLNTPCTQEYIGEEIVDTNWPKNNPLPEMTWDLPQDKARVKLPLPNVWLGVSVENQKTAADRIPLLLKTPAAIRWISAEPLLGKIDLNQNYLNGNHFGDLLDWVVAGGESQHGSRPSHPEWFRSLRDQCEAARIPFLFKQWGDWSEGRNRHDWQTLAIDGTKRLTEQTVQMSRVGKKQAGRTLDGKTHDQYPQTK